ncbi:MAG: hypothetical protein ACXV5S_00655 [Acidimicrobiales bacterium]
MLDGNFEIYTVEPDGSGLLRLTNNQADDEMPAWSPDGTRIAFMSDRDASSDTYNQDIYTMNADGSRVVQITESPGLDYEPAWSPDGTKIAFDSPRLGEGNEEVFIMNADGSGQTRLTNAPGVDRNPNWSPDGSKLVFECNGAGSICVMNPDGSALTQLPQGTIYENYNPAWSPDGTKIVFVSGREGPPQLFTMNADGSDQVRLTESVSSDLLPDWQPIAALPTSTTTTVSSTVPPAAPVAVSPGFTG